MDYGAGRDQINERLLMRNEPLLVETQEFFVNSYNDQCIYRGCLPFAFDDDEDNEDSGYEVLGDGEKNCASRWRFRENNAGNRDVDRLKTDQEPSSSSGFFTRVFGWTKEYAMLACFCFNT